MSVSFVTVDNQKVIEISIRFASFCNAIEPKLREVQIETKTITNKQIETFVPCRPKPTNPAIYGVVSAKIATRMQLQQSN